MRGSADALIRLVLLVAGLGLLVGPGAAVAQTGPGGVGDATSSIASSDSLMLWLRSDEGVTSSGGTVSAWADQSGNGNDFTQATDGRQPALSGGALNGEDVLQFDGDDDGDGDYLELSKTIMESTQDFDVFVVTKIKSTETDEFDRVLSNEESGKGNRLYNFGVNASPADKARGILDLTTKDGGKSGTDAATVLGNGTLGAFHIYGHQLVPVGGTDPSDMVLEIDGSEVDRSADAGSTKAVGASRFRIGSISHSVGQQAQFDIAETIIYKESLNDAERLIVENYLSTKYGLSLPMGDDRFTHDASHGTDVAGIGQASNGDQHTDAQSDALRLLGPSALSNGDYLLFGHDAADASSFTTTETPSSIDERIAREWRLDETDGGDGDGVGTVTVQIDSDDLPSAASGNDYYVLVDGDGDFTTTGDQTRTRLTLDSSTTYNASGVAVADGDYVTLGIGARPKTPQNLTAESDLNQRVLLSWDAVNLDRTGSSTTINEYRIYKNTTNTFPGGSPEKTTTSTSDVEVSGLTNGTQYYFWVTAVNDVGESSEQGTPASATPALKAFFAASSSSAKEGGTPSVELRLSDTHSDPVDVSIADNTGNLQSIVSIASIDNAGGGYSEGDIIGEDDGTDGGSGLQIEVTGVDGSGAVTSANVVVGGSGYTSDPTSFTTESGSPTTQATFSLNRQGSGDDYELTLSSGTVTIPSGSQSVTIDNDGTAPDLDIDGADGDGFNADDTAPENTEVVDLSITGATTSNATATTGSQTTHDFSINDDDIPRKVFFVDGIGTADDGNTKGDEDATVTYRVELSSADPVNDTKVEYAFDLASGTANADDVNSTSTVTIASGDTFEEFTLPISSDNTYENDETVDVEITSAENAGLDDNPSSNDPTNGRYTTLTHTIQNDDNQPEVSFNSPSSSETEDSPDVSIQVDISPTSSEDITVSLGTTGNGTATGSGADYTLATTSVTIPSGQSSVTLDDSDLSIVGDGLDENDETVEPKLQSVTSGTAGIDTNNDVHTLTINDDDPKPKVAFQNSASSALESAGSAQVTLELNDAGGNTTTSGRDVTVNYSTGGTASGSGTDYSDDDGGSVTITAGNSSETIDLSLVDDVKVEGDETVTFSFSGGDLTNADAGGTTSHTFTIQDDDFGTTGPAGVGITANNKLWLRADEGVSTSSGTVTSWADQSGNGEDLGTSSGNPALNTGVVNGRPVVELDGDDYLQGDSLMGGLSEFDVFAVADIKTSGSDSYGRLLSEENSGGGNRVYNFALTQASDKARTIIDFTSKSGAEVIEGTSTIGDGTFNVYDQFLSSASSGTLGLRVDGALEDNVTGVGTVQDRDTGPFRMGAIAHSENSFMNVEVAEVIVYDTGLNETRRTIVENYLAAKYGLSLDAGDKYAGDQSGNGNYDHGMFGIGQSTSDDFHKAAETAGLRFVTAGGRDNGDYLLAGHRAAVNAVNASDISGVSGTLEGRFERAWYTDVTDPGGDLTVDVTVDLSAAGLEGPAGAKGNYVLIQRNADASDGTNWSAVQNGADAVSGDEITFNGVSLTDGKEITLATTDAANSPLDANSLVVEGTAGTDGSDQGWRYLGLPVTGGTAGDLLRADGSQFIDFDVEWMAYTNPGGSVQQGSGDMGWTAVQDASTALTNGRGFILWFYDDIYYPIDPSITLQTASGLAGPGASNVTVGDDTPSGDDPSLAQSDKQYLLANPYAVPFDLGSLNGSGFDDLVQVWEPNATSPADGDDGNAGSFVTRSRSGNDNVASWQGFLLTRSSTGSGDTQVTFNSSGRAPTATPSLVGSKAATEQPTQHRVPLQLTAHDSEGTLTALDRAVSVLFHERATDGRDRYDAPKFEPMTQSFATLAPVAAGSDTTLRAQESRPLPRGQTVRLPLSFQREGVRGTFKIRIPEGEKISTRTPSIPDDWTVELIDTKGTSDPSDDERHPLTPGGPPYTFEVAGSKAASAPEEPAEAAVDSSEVRTAPPPTLRRLTRASLDRKTSPDRRAGPDREAAPDRKTGPAHSTGASAKAAGSSSTRFTLAVRPAEALPVEMTDLAARRNEKRAVVTWKTASETNNAGFTVQHQRLPAGDTSATPVASDWRNLGFREGAGTTTETNSYRFETDALDYGRHVFRLKQVDTDGTQTPTQSVAVQMRLEKPFAVEAPYPNPARQTATLPVTVRERQAVTVEVYDVLGRRVRVAHDREIRGQKTKRISLPIHSLSSGSYFVRVHGEDFAVTRRLTVVR